jgi:Mor family transcriptional regulator
MKQRCANPKNQKYYAYGERGIKVCDSWRNSFEAFYSDMGPRPTPKHTIERKDNNGNYEPDNCIWAPPEVQMRNRRNTKFIEYQGERRSIPEWSEVLGIPYRILRQRINRDHLPIELAFELNKYQRFGCGDESSYHKLTDSQVAEIRNRRKTGERRVDLAKEFGVSTSQIYNICTGRQRSQGAVMVTAVIGDWEPQTNPQREVIAALREKNKAVLSSLESKTTVEW